MSPAPLGIDLAPDPMCGVRVGVIEWVNARWADCFRPIAAGTPLAAVVHAGDLDAAADWLAAPDPAVPGVVVRIAGHGGEWVMAECTARAGDDGLVVMAARTGALVAPAIRFAPVATSSAVRAVLEADDTRAALGVIASAVDDFHPGASTAFFTGRAGDVELLHVDAHTLAPGRPLSRDECMALAAGGVHVSDPDDDEGPTCAHAHDEHVTVCLPVEADGEHLGLLVVHVPPRDGAPPVAPGDPDSIVPRLENVAVALGEVAKRERLAERADTDALTGLPNRAAFVEVATRELAVRAGRSGAVGLVMLDLDHFKEINDTLGHQAGDAVLIAVAGLMRGAVRARDTVARLGGDEFAVLLPGCDAATVEAVANRLCATIAGAADEVRKGATASAGAVLVTGSGVTWDDAYAAADATLYRAKGAGRDGAVLGPLDLGAS